MGRVVGERRATGRMVRVVFFFFQAEDGIRDRNVTGGQTCALPISGTAHLVFRSRLEVPVAQGTATITAPDGRTAVQQLSHAFWNGPLYLSRRDGRSFVPGVYTVRDRKSVV